MGHFQQNFHYLSTMGEYWASCCISTGSLLIKAVGVPMKVSSSTSYSVTITRIAAFPSNVRSCLMKSMEMDSHGHGGIGSCLRKPYGLCWFTLECAHTMQDQMYCLTTQVSPSQ